MRQQCLGRSICLDLVAIIVVAASMLSFSAHAAANKAFGAGVAASKQGDYKQAVRYFQRAREQGVDTAALHHNLGVAYYRLGRYARARSAFKRAAQTPSMRALSHYNLGLVEQAAGNEDAARDWYRQAYEGASTAQLRRLAAARLDIEPDPVVPYTLYSEAFSGYDSNPRLAEENNPVDPVREREGDAVLGALAAGRYLLSGDWANGFAAYGNAFISRYPDLDDEDITAATAGGSFYNRVGAWQQRYQLAANHLRLGDDALTNSARAGLRGKRWLTNRLGLELRARIEYFDGDEDSGFGYLTGWRADTRAGLNGRAGAWLWQTHYEFEYNDRDDLAVGDDFFSVSPIRHELDAELARPLIGRLRGEVDVTYRLSRYPDAEKRSGRVIDEREDDRLSLGIGLSYPVATRWIGRIEADYRDNDSNFDQFDYERTEVLLSLGYSLR